MAFSLPILAVAFITPAFFAAGVLLASVPIIIHILNRRRFKIVNWAAMEFLLRALRKNRRRLRFEQWLLLAVTDVARPSTSIFLSSAALPDKSPANVAYFEEQTLRYLRVAEARLAGRNFLADELSVADFALYPLYAVRKALVDKAGDLPELTRWGAVLAARPGVDKGMRAAD